MVIWVRNVVVLIQVAQLKPGKSIFRGGSESESVSAYVQLGGTSLLDNQSILS
jgi:hypothetical protein